MLLCNEMAAAIRFRPQAICWSAALCSVLVLLALPIAAQTEAVPQQPVVEDVEVLPALSPAVAIDLSTGIGRSSGTVSTSQQIYRFNVTAGRRVTIDINVTQILPGQPFTDDDSQIFLFDSTGRLMAENDDDSHTYQSRIRNFVIPRDGTYFAVITTFNNDPILDDNNLLIGWRNNGSSNIQYDLTIITSTPRR